MLNKLYTDDGSVSCFDEYHSSDIMGLIRTGNWLGLENMPVAFAADRSVTSTWKDNRWESKQWIRGTERKLTVFITSKDEHLSDGIINEIKAFAYLTIYKINKVLSVSTISGYIKSFKRIARYLYTLGINSFEGLSNDLIRQFQKGINKLHADNAAINMLRRMGKYLPFTVQLNAPPQLKIENTQFPVIPERLQMTWMQSAEKVVLEWIQYSTKLSQFISEQIKLYEKTESEIIHQLRSGQRTTGCISRTTEKQKKNITNFLADLESHDIPLADQNKNADWMTLFEQNNLMIDRVHIYTKLRFAYANCYRENSRVLKFRNKTYASFSELIEDLRLIEQHCIYLIFNLSGMRANEFHKLSPEYGAQTIPINGHTVHIFHSGQQKIKVGYQLKKDVFVTTALGHKAFKLLNAIYEPFRDKAPKERMIFKVSFSLRAPVLNMHMPNFSKHFTGKLTKKDIENLRVSEHGCNNFTYNEGYIFTFSSHMARRSIAYYLVALELCGFPQIKQQYSHLSQAMSIYYATNASKKNEMIMHAEVGHEREEQLALTLIRLKERAAEEKLSGGKGMIWNQKSDKVLSINEHKNLLRNNKEFITAVAPGMYCTNRNCCKTAQLSLVHDLGCNESIVEHTAWIEGRRASSISKLMTLYEIDDLTPQDVSKEILNIRAAEQMINKHNGEGSIEPYIAPEGINRMLFTEVV